MELRSALLERVERARPRAVRIVADAGWGKSRFVRALAARKKSAVIVGAAQARHRDQFERVLSDAINDAQPALPELIAIEDVHALDESAASALARLLRPLAVDSTVVLTSRAALPFELSRYFAPHELFSIGPADLALSDDEQRGLIDDGTLDEATLQRALRLTHGWPIAALLFGRLARERRLSALLDRLEDRAFDVLHEYVESEIINELPPEEVDLVLLCAASSTVTDDDVRRVLDSDAPARLQRLLEQRLYVSREGETYRVVPLVSASLQRTRPAAIAMMRARCAAARDAIGDGLGAATLWMENGDALRAAASLDHVGSPPLGTIPSRAYHRVLTSIPLEALLTTHHPYVTLLSSPRVRAVPDPYVVQAFTICEKLSEDADRELRVSAQLALATFSFYASQIRRADELLEQLDAEHRREPFLADRAMLFTATRAAVLAARGRTADAAALWDSMPLQDAEGRSPYVTQQFELRLAIRAAAGELQLLKPDLERWVALARESGDPIWIALARTYEEFVARALGEKAANPEAILREIEAEELAEADPIEYDRLINVADLPLSSQSRLSGAYLADMAYEQQDPQTARRMLETAIAAFDRIGVRYNQISARLLMAFVPGSPRARLIHEARQLAGEMQDPRVRESVEAIVAGRFDQGKSFPLAARRVHHARFNLAENTLRIEILKARVMRGGVPVPVRAREFELLTALALARAPLSRGRLATLLWGEDAAGNAPALRMAIHRLRRQLGDMSAVVFQNATYRLGPTVTVDVLDIEAELAALRRMRSLTVRECNRLREINAALAVEPPEVYGDWDWMTPHLAYLADLRHHSAKLLGENALCNGDPEDTLTIAQAILRVDPLDEPIVELAIRALLATGRRPEAVRRARQYADDLARNLGGDPSSELIRQIAIEDAGMRASAG